MRLVSMVRSSYSTDGVDLQQLTNINPLGNSHPVPIQVINGELIFTAEARNNDKELYKTDGTAVSLIADLNPEYEINPFGIPEGGSNPRDFTLFNNQLYFSARNCQWRS